MNNKNKDEKYSLYKKPMFYNSKKDAAKNKGEKTNDLNEQNSEIRTSFYNSKYNEINNGRLINFNDNKWSSRYNRSKYNFNLYKNIYYENEEIFKEHEKQLSQKNSNGLINIKNEVRVFSIENNNKTEEKANGECRSFEELELHKEVLDNLTKMKFTSTTPIQNTIIPYILQGNDCIGCAETGSGKTVAFLAPIISLMLTKGLPEKDDYYLKSNTNYILDCSYPVVIILVPTRELAEQIYVEARKLTHNTGIIVSKCYGGIPIFDQIKELKIGVDILIATPGRLIELIEKRFVYLNLVSYLIIDENDRMLDMGFEPQLKEILSSPSMPPKESTQNLMFSATVNGEILSTASQFLKERYILITNRSAEESVIEYGVNKNVEQKIYFVKEEDKKVKLHEIFQGIKGNVIVF